MVDYHRACAILRSAGEDRAADVLAAVAADPHLGDLTDDRWWTDTDVSADEDTDDLLALLP